MFFITDYGSCSENIAGAGIITDNWSSVELTDSKTGKKIVTKASEIWSNPYYNNKVFGLTGYSQGYSLAQLTSNTLWQFTKLIKYKKTVAMNLIGGHTLLSVVNFDTIRQLIPLTNKPNEFLSTFVKIERFSYTYFSFLPSYLFAMLVIYGLPNDNIIKMPVLKDEWLVGKCILYDIVDPAAMTALLTKFRLLSTPEERARAGMDFYRSMSMLCHINLGEYFAIRG